MIAPHIRRAVTIGDLFEVEQREANIFREVMDAFTTAIFVVDVDMKLGFANTAAENLLSDGTIIKSSGPSQKSVWIFLWQPRYRYLTHHHLRSGNAIL